MRVTNVHAKNDVRLDDLPAPECGPSDVLVAMKACGICGTDLTYLQMGGMPVGGRCPLPLGHEPAGQVVEVGEDVTGIAAGMRVTFNPTTDMADAIGSGGAQGALSDLVAVRGAVLGHSVFTIPDEIPFEVAALTEPLAVALHAVNRCAIEPGQTAVVFGAGPVGVGIAAWLKIRGAGHVVSVDFSEPRLEMAQGLGADGVVRGDDDVVARLRELHGTAHVLGMPVAATDVWIDAAGAPAVIDTIMSGAREHARAVVVAVHKEPVPIDLVSLLIRELNITASMAYPTEFGDVAGALAEHWQTFAPMITDRYALDDVADALTRAGSADVRGKVMITI